MRKIHPTLLVLCATLLWAGAAQARPGRPGLTCSQRQTQAVKGLDGLLNLGQKLCTADLSRHGCDADVCQEPVFPGDGYPNPDAEGVSGHGAALRYTDNGDGTFTDNDTLLMWEEKKIGSGDVHDYRNTYQWSRSGTTAANGTLFTVFRKTLNNTCDGDESTPCTTNGDCSGIGDGLCGFAGHRDWRIPNVKELQSLVDYARSNPAISPMVPGATWPFEYWSVTTPVGYGPRYADVVDFGYGNVLNWPKTDALSARAVRNGP